MLDRSKESTQTKRDTLALQVGGLGVLLATAPRNKSVAAKVQRGNFGQMQGRRNRLFEMDNEKKIKLATWNIRTMLQVGNMMEIYDPL